jgi:maleylacetoacetate isomerase
LKGLSYELIERSHSISAGNAVGQDLNPAQTVPTLVIHGDTDGGKPVTLTQSIAALEYLDEAFPDSVQLLPGLDDVKGRAEVRRLVNVVATDIHPLTTVRVSRAIRDIFPCDSQVEATQPGNRAWELHWMRKGLAVYEELLKQTAGWYSVGDKITMADVCLMPELWTASKFGLDVSDYPTVHRIFQRLSAVEAFAMDEHLRS